MLTNDDRTRIRQEELFRQEIQKELSAKEVSPLWKQAFSSFWTVANSTLGFFILSTIFLPYAITRFTRAQSEAQAAARTRHVQAERVQHLDLEIEGRLAQFLANVEPLVIDPHDRQFSLRAPYTLSDIRRQWRIFKMAPSANAEQSSIYNEFRARTTVSLVVELSSILKAQAENEKAIPHTTEHTQQLKSRAHARLLDIARHIQTDAIFQVEPSNKFLPIWQILYQRILDERWTNLFPYTDCRVTPFCDSRKADKFDSSSPR
jgi:hypothetical protein